MSSELRSHDTYVAMQEVEKLREEDKINDFLYVVLADALKALHRYQSPQAREARQRLLQLLEQYDGGEEEAEEEPSNNDDAVEEEAAEEEDNNARRVRQRTE